MEISTFKAMLELAERSAPLFFALLFAVVLTHAVHHHYCKARVRKDPPATQSEIRLYENYLRANFGFGIVLVLFAIGWWVWKSERNVTYTYRLAITGVEKNLALDVTDYYSRRAYRNGPTPDRLMEDVYIIIQRRSPFEVGEVFHVGLWVPDGTPEGQVSGTKRLRLPVIYKGRDEETLELRFGSNGPELVKVSEQMGDDFELQRIASHDSARAGESLESGESR